MKYTQEFLKSMHPQTIFAAGIVWDTEGINVTGKRALLTWAAVRGDNADWSVYVALEEESFEATAVHGEKVSLGTACALIDCDEAMQGTYRS